MLPWVCTVMNDSRRQNVARTLEPYSAVMIFLFLFFVLTLSVIYYWTDAPQHDISVRRLKISKYPQPSSPCYLAEQQFIFDLNFDQYRAACYQVFK